MSSNHAPSTPCLSHSVTAFHIFKHVSDMLFSCDSRLSTAAASVCICGHLVRMFAFCRRFTVLADFLACDFYICISSTLMTIYHSNSNNGNNFTFCYYWLHEKSFLFPSFCCSHNCLQQKFFVSIFSCFQINSNNNKKYSFPSEENS